MSDDRDVSVLMATFNGHRHLHEQLASITAQSLPPLEIVISDDGSTDDTLSIVHAFRRQSSVPVSVIEGKGGLGASQNFLGSLRHCRGRYIAFCDQDDVWQPSKLERSRSRLRSDQSLLAIHQSIITDTELNPTGVMTQGIHRNSVVHPGHLDPYLGEFSGWGNTMVFDSSLIPLLLSRRPHQPRDERPLSHDTWTYVLAAALGRVSHIAEPLVWYRQHGANVYGVEVESQWSRIRRSRTSPVDVYTDRIGFYLECATAFREAHVLELWNTNDLGRAIGLYEKRGQEVLLRRDVYTGRSRLCRFRSFMRLYASGRMLRAFGENRGLNRVRSIAKDLLLGVWTGTLS